MTFTLLRLSALCAVLSVGCGGESSAPSLGPTPPASTPPAPARVVPDLQGHWAGTYRLTGCTESPTTLGFCAGFTEEVPIGSLAAASLTIMQSGTSISGTFVLDEDVFFGQFQSAIDAEGWATFTGSTDYFSDIDLTGNVTWRITSTTPGRLVGTIQEVFAGPGLGGGEVRLAGEIVEITRRSSASVLTPRTSSHARPRTLADIVRALVRP